MWVTARHLVTGEGENADSLMVISVFAVILQDGRSVTDWL